GNSPGRGNGLGTPAMTASVGPGPANLTCYHANARRREGSARILVRASGIHGTVPRAHLIGISLSKANVVGGPEIDRKNPGARTPAHGPRPNALRTLRRPRRRPPDGPRPDSDRPTYPGDVQRADNRRGAAAIARPEPAAGRRRRRGAGRPDHRSDRG